MIELLCKFPKCVECMWALGLEDEGAWIEDSLTSRCELVNVGVHTSSGCSKGI